LLFFLLNVVTGEYCLLVYVRVLIHRRYTYVYR